MPEVDQGGRVLTPTRFAELTGVSRERLRAWERRYGFPVPVRQDGGPRRYLTEDVQRVVAVRRASEDGIPMRTAIQRAASDAVPDGIDDRALIATLRQAPVPVAILSGPQPLRVEWVNAALRETPLAPRTGAELLASCPHLHGSRCVALARQHFAHDLPPSAVEHPGWHGAGQERSVLYRLPGGPSQRPLVALVGLGTAVEAALRADVARRDAAVAALERRAERHERWLDAIAAVADVFRHATGPDVVGRCLDVLIRQTRAVDAGLATYAAGELVLGPTRRGATAGRRLMVSAHPELARALRDREALWLDSAAAAQLAVPLGLHAAAIPVAVGGEMLGLLVVLFDEVEPHDQDNGRLLVALSAALGFALLRDRLADELRALVSERRARNRRFERSRSGGPTTAG